MTKLTLKCYNCSEPIETDELVVHSDGSNWCQACADDNLFYCENCTKYQTTDEYTVSYSSEVWCGDCANEYLFQCVDCEQWAHNDDRVSVSGRGEICQECYQDGEYFTCYSCDDPFHSDDSNYCEECEQDFCSYCYENSHECSREQECQYEFKQGKKCKLLDNSRFIGVEIEADNGHRRDIELPHAFGITHDGSLSNDGVEVVTPPATGTEHVKNVKLATKALKMADFEITEDCGLHVHFDMRDKQGNFKYLAHLMTTFYAIEDALYAMQPRSRHNNHYCKWLRNDFNFFDFYGKKYIQDFDYKYYKHDKSSPAGREQLEYDKRTHHCSKRYYGVNFHSVFYRGSLEIRIHSGSMNSIKILRWCELLQSIIKWVDTSYNYKTVLKLAELSVTPAKLKLMGRVFKLSKPLRSHVKARINQFHNMGLEHNFEYGIIPTKQVRRLRYTRIGVANGL